MSLVLDTSAALAWAYAEKPPVRDCSWISSNCSFPKTMARIQCVMHCTRATAGRPYGDDDVFFAAF
jgi:hypothetical protein